MKSKELTWFYMFKEYRKAIERMSPEMVKRVLLLLYDYFETGEEPNLTGEEYFAFCLLRKGVDVAKEHFVSNVEKNRRSANIRWHGKAETFSNPEQVRQALDKDLDKPKPEKQEKSKGSRLFKPPNLDEIKAYCKERGNNIDPEYFYDYQVSRNWVLSNGKKMVDWKATIRTWEKNNYNKGRKDSEDLANDTSGYGDDSYLWNN